MGLKHWPDEFGCDKWWVRGGADNFFFHRVTRGIDVEREIPKLASYLGHVHANETYWYLEAVPELLELAARRLESPRLGKPGSGTGSKLIRPTWRRATPLR